MTIGTRKIPPETARTANPVQTTAIFGVGMVLLVNGVDEENPSMIAAGVGTILI
jgi:hypothetical protein